MPIPRMTTSTAALNHRRRSASTGPAQRRVKIRSFYGLQRIRGRLERALANDELARPLAEIDEDRTEDLVSPLYAALDNPSEQPWNVLGTTLSKILHRKRPNSLVLHDR